VKKHFLKTLKIIYIKQVTNENPDLIVLSGDLTTQGYVNEYNDAAIFVDELKSITDTHVIPGNHDARNVGMLHFKKLIGERKFLHIDNDGGFAIIGL
jgi:3',5'-cyclic AMP phosphodiesterase CpdA